MSKSLEALEDIYNSLINDIELEEDEFYNPSDDIKYWKEKYNVVKQDLNRLEKLERMFEIMQRHFYVCRGFMESRITTEKNFKECLKNSWTKYYNGMPVIDKDYDELFNLWNEVIVNE